MTTNSEIDRQTDNIEQVKIGKKNIILDATLLTAIMRCGRYSDLRFNLNLMPITGKSNSLETGSIVHKFLEVYYGSQIKGVNRKDSIGFAMAAAEMYIQGCPYCTNFVPSESIPKPTCGHKINDYPGVVNTPKDDEKYKLGWLYVLDTCAQYAEHWKNDHWVPLEVETVKGKIIYEDDEIRVLWKAKLDWTADSNQGIFPIDHKTMKMRRDSLSLNNQFMGQCVVMGTSNVFINKIGFQSTLKPEEKFTRHPISYSSQRLNEWMTETVPYYAKLLLMYNESEHYPPNYGSCETKFGFCEFHKVCESNPMDREDTIKKLFVVGAPWNPTSADDMNGD